MKNRERFNILFDELVPAIGKAESMAGELVRAVARIGYRWMNDGDKLNIGYGKETCNPAGRFLIHETPVAIAAIVVDMWQCYDDEKYEEKLDELCGAVVDYVERTPELRGIPSPDFFSYRDPVEDVDDEDDVEWV